MKHIRDAIDLCHRKLVNERERLTAAADAPSVAAATRGGTATVDRTRELLDEIEAELRAVSAAGRDFKSQYEETPASDEPPAETVV